MSFMFQFQCGTIQSRSNRICRYGKIVSIPVWYNLEGFFIVFTDLNFLFQFQCGTIQRDNRISLFQADKMFQFQCGTIQRHIIAIDPDVYKSFQFQCGTIQRTRIKLYKSSKIVSIPVWYNLENKPHHIGKQRHFGFNSSVVQFRESQNHTGTYADMFQFQCGTIQRLGSIMKMDEVVRFNSSVVQFRAILFCRSIR